MKAYKAWDEYNYEGYSTVVFAENASKARNIAFHSETCEDARFIDIRVRRLPEMDKHYRGLNEIDWYCPADRRALVEIGWYCLEPESWECEGCPANDICDYFKEKNDAETDKPM